MDLELLQNEVVEISDEEIVNELNQAYCSELGGVAIACSSCFFADKCSKFSDNIEPGAGPEVQPDTDLMDFYTSLQSPDVLIDASVTQEALKEVEAIPQPSKSKYLDRLMDDNINIVVADSIAIPAITKNPVDKVITIPEVTKEVVEGLSEPSVDVEPIIVEEVLAHEPEEVISISSADVLEPVEAIVYLEGENVIYEVEETELEPVYVDDSVLLLDLNQDPIVDELEVDNAFVELVDETEDNSVTVEITDTLKTDEVTVTSIIKDEITDDIVPFVEYDRTTVESFVEDSSSLDIGLEVEVEVGVDEVPIYSEDLQLDDDSITEDILVEPQVYSAINQTVDDRKFWEIVEGVSNEPLSVDWEPVIGDDSNQVFEKQFIDSSNTVCARDLVDLIREMARFALN